MSDKPQPPTIVGENTGQESGRELQPGPGEPIVPEGNEPVAAEPGAPVTPAPEQAGAKPASRRGRTAVVLASAVLGAAGGAFGAIKLSNGPAEPVAGPAPHVTNIVHTYPTEIVKIGEDAPAQSAAATQTETVTVDRAAVSNNEETQETGDEKTSQVATSFDSIGSMRVPRAPENLSGSDDEGDEGQDQGVGRDEGQDGQDGDTQVFGDDVGPGIDAPSDPQLGDTDPNPPNSGSDPASTDNGDTNTGGSFDDQGTKDSTVVDGSQAANGGSQVADPQK